MQRAQFRVLYREFLFRIVDLELLSAHAEGDSRKLLGQLASLLIFFSVALTLWAGLWAANAGSSRLPVLMTIIGSWTIEHVLIATTMLAVGLFAVLSWESTFPDRRDVLVLGPLPVRARTLFLAKVAAVASALGVTILSLHGLAGIAWPLALARSGSAPAPALVFDAAFPPARAAEFPAILDRDIAPMLARLDLAAADGRAGIVVGVSERGARRVMAYGAAKPDSLFEIGSITKTFTALLLARMAAESKLDLRDPVRDLLPAGTVPKPAGFEITLLDLATHHSGLDRMPDNMGPGNQRETYTEYHASDLFEFLHRHGVEKPANAKYLYSNLGFTVLGAALENRGGASYAELLRREITGPLGLKDTTIALSPEQRARFLEGHDARRLPAAAWDLDAFASAGGIRSTAGDMLTYLDAQLHPERTPLRAAIVDSQRLRAVVAGNVRTALAWQYNPDSSVYAHNGATGGFTSACFFDPRRDFAAVVLMNAAPVAFPFVEVLGAHVLQRLAGEPAISLTPVSVPAASPIRSLPAYWITMTAAGVFMFCCVLSLQGVAAQLLPRRWFLRASSILQLAVFCLLVVGYFLQRSPTSVLVAGPKQPWTAWIPSYWFVGMYQQLSGSLHPALAPFAWRAWIGLAVALALTALAYAASYLRTLRRIVEEPEIAPDLRSRWLPRLGGPFETAIAQFSVRTLFRSRQHRMIFAFYLGVGLAFAILFLNAPREISGPETGGGPWDESSIPLLAATTMLIGFWVAGAQVVFALPLELRANWIFRVTPFAAGPRCLRARRWAIYTLSALPAWTISAAVLLPLWPWRTAAVHLTALACLGIVLAEFSPEGAQKLPFTCSYLPGRSNLHVTFLFWMYMLLAGVAACAIAERRALSSAAGSAALVAGPGIAALVSILRNNRLARSREVELRFEEEPADRLLSLNLSWDGPAERKCD